MNMNVVLVKSDELCSLPDPSTTYIYYLVKTYSARKTPNVASLMLLTRSPTEDLRSLPSIASSIVEATVHWRPRLRLCLVSGKKMSRLFETTRTSVDVDAV